MFNQVSVTGVGQQAKNHRFKKKLIFSFIVPSPCEKNLLFPHTLGLVTSRTRSYSVFPKYFLRKSPLKLVRLDQKGESTGCRENIQHSSFLVLGCVSCTYFLDVYAHHNVSCLCFRDGAHPDHALAIAGGENPPNPRGAITRIRGTETP